MSLLKVFLSHNQFFKNLIRNNVETIDDPVLRKQSIGILVGHIKTHFPKVLEEYGVDQAYKLIKDKPSFLNFLKTYKIEGKT